MHLVSINANVAIDKAAPMLNDLWEIVVKLLEVYHTILFAVHQSETELMLLVLWSID